MAAINDEQIIALLNLPGVGSRTAWAIVQFAERSGESFASIETLSRSARAAGVKVPEFGAQEGVLALDEARRSLDALNTSGSVVIPCNSPQFPRLLTAIPNPPLMLFIEGNLEALTGRPTVAVIGTREPSNYGLKWGRRIAQVLGEAGFSIVSGLAEGCDTVAHQGALDSKSPTVAFLAHGFGRIYPKSNEKLARQIVAEGGCLATEYLPGEPPRRSSFVERDRLQSGASRGIVVVETDIEGGTMHTVGFAKAQKRLIATLDHPPSLLSLEKSRGNQMLIQRKEAYGIGSKEHVDAWIASLLNFSTETLARPLGQPAPNKKGQFEMY